MNTSGNKSVKTEKIEKIIEEFESKYRTRTVDRIYELENEYIVKTNTSMAIKDLDPYFGIEKGTFKIEHYTLRSKNNKKKIPKGYAKHLYTNQMMR